MVISQTETSDVNSRLKEWRIIPYNFPALVVDVHPPSNCEVSEPSEDLREEMEDLQDGLETKLKYRTLGVEGFIRYGGFGEREFIEGR